MSNKHWKLNIPCKFFAKGRCRYGAYCEFGHAPAPTAEKEKDNWARELCGVFVQFQDGARIAKLSLRSDFSAVSITGFPSVTSTDRLLGWLFGLGFDPEPESIKIRRNEGLDGCRFDVQVEDGGFATRLCTFLGRQVEATGIVAQPIPVAMARAQNSTSVDQSKIYCSWEKGGEDEGVDAEMETVLVKSALAVFGELHWWEDHSQGESTQMSAKARFLDQEAACRAVQGLDQTPLPFDGDRTLTVKLFPSIKRKVSSDIFQASHASIKEAQKTWKAQDISCVDFGPQNDYVVVMLEGTDTAALARAKDELSVLVSGEIAMDDDKELWLPSFGLDWPIVQQLRDIETRLGVVLEIDKRRCHVRVYGEGWNRREAVELLATLVQDDGVDRRIVQLDEKQLEWARDGGLRRLLGEFGKHVFAFDGKSVPNRVYIYGSSTTRDAVCKIITDAKTEERQGGGVECAICFCEAENPVATQCPHTYCAECFEGLCTNGAESDDGFCLRCAGDDGRCGKVLGMAEIQLNVSPAALERVFEASLRDHVRRNPDAFSYCSTPDCPQIYRVGAAGTVRSCPQCLECMCAACGGRPHGEMSCDEAEDERTGGYRSFERAREEYGFKGCPRCRTEIEKTEGCNHMECGSCRVHICWRCMETFEEAAACYAHLNGVHGGIGLEDGQGVIE